jgi:hypothetical protein
VFSPNSDGLYDSLTFSLDAAPTDGIDNWKASIRASGGSEIAAFSGAGRPPATLIWDGSAAGRSAADGEYTAVLQVEYLKGNVSEARSGRFAVDTRGPALTLRVTPKPFSPDGDGTDDIATLAIGATDATSIGGYRVDILDPAGNAFRRFSGSGSPITHIEWNGRSESGELVQSASDYGIEYSVWDAVGNSSVVRDELPIDILVIREGDRLRIVISSIYFEPFTTNYLNVPAAEAAQNIATLDRLAVVLKKYPDYRIRAEGHAVRIYWNNPVRGATEEAEVLAPLSLERAEVIREALIERGVRAERITASGFGGTRPVVPHSDLDNRWKNRRVEFILLK